MTFIRSASSTIRKSAGTPMAVPCSRSRLPHRRWKVEIHTARASPAGSIVRSRCAISLAALRVKVSAAMRVRQVVRRIQIDGHAAPAHAGDPMRLDAARRQLASHQLERWRRSRAARSQGCDDRGAPDTGSRPSSSWGVGQVVGIVAIGMNARDAEDPLTDQVRERAPNLPRCAFGGQTPGERLDQAVHTLSRLEQVSAAVGTRALLIERGVEWLVEQIREQDSLWYRVRRHAGVSVVAKRL